MSKKVIPKHLGGHGGKTHLDEGSLIYLRHTFGIDSMLDIGCGLGGMVLIALERGMTAMGIDGDFSVERPEQLNGNVIIHDFTEGKVDLDKQFDLGWCVEVLEHIYEKFLPNVFDSFNKCKYIFCTASPKRGHHHVNIQPVEYWIKKFEENEFTFLEEETSVIRALSSMRREFVRNTGMIFKNNKL